jgi:hypothetical protein
VLVERNRLLELQNHGSESASTLLLGLLRPEGQLPIGPVFGAPAALWVPYPEEQEQISHRQVVIGEIGGLAREETILFAACLRWTDPSAEVVSTTYPGPVGLLVLRGQALVNEVDRLNAGDCWLSPSYSPLRIRAAEGAPEVLLFGALRESAASLISPGSGETAMTNSERLPCSLVNAAGSAT